MLIVAFGALLNQARKRSDDKVVAAIEAGDAINPPDETNWVSDRQVEFTDGILADILKADMQLVNIGKMSSGSSGEKEKKRRAKKELYDNRIATWEDLTTPLDFESFAGRVEDINTSRVASGPNAGKTRVDIKIKLFGSGTVLEDQMILDEQNNPIKTSNTSIWEITNANGSKLDWFDITEGFSVNASGNFTRYTESVQWAHCCVASTGFPKFRVDLNTLIILSE